jgi:hypothetical protein
MCWPLLTECVTDGVRQHFAGHVCQFRRLDPGNNVAKNVIDFSIAIPRERLRPNYGDGFRGAPLDASQSSQGRIDQNRGVNRDEPKTAQKEELDRASEI